MHVIFDLDDTLYTFADADYVAVGKMADYCKGNFGWTEDYTRLHVGTSYSEVAQRIGADNPSIHNRLLRFKHVLEMGGQKTHPHMWNLYNIYWDTLLDLIEPEPGLLDFMDKLTAKGFTLGVCSNMCTGIQHRKLAKLGIIDRFSHIVISEEVGTEKPNPIIFRRCMDLEGVGPQECVMIGDNFKRDIVGALKVGMKAAYYVRPRAGETFDENVARRLSDPFVKECCDDGKLTFFGHYEDLNLGFFV